MTKRTAETAGLTDVAPVERPVPKRKTGLFLRWPLPVVLQIAARCSTAYQCQVWRKLSPWWNEEYFARYCRSSLIYHHPHPRDKDVWFREEGHRYKIKGEKQHGYMSVTTFGHVLFNEFNADSAIVMMMDSSRWPSRPEYGMLPRQIRQQWARNRDQAAEDGTTMHANCENYYNGVQYETIHPGYQAARQLCQSASNFEQLWDILVAAAHAFISDRPQQEQARIRRFMGQHEGLLFLIRAQAERFYREEPWSCENHAQGFRYALQQLFTNVLSHQWLVSLFLSFRESPLGISDGAWSWLPTQIQRYIQHNESYDTTYREYEFFETFRQDFPDLIPWRSEWRIYSERLGIVGTIDMLFYRKDTPLDKYGCPVSMVMVDWKRSKTINYNNAWQSGRVSGCSDDLDDCNYQHYTIQLNLYKLILEMEYGIQVEEMFLIVMHPNQQSYLRVPIVYDKERMGRIRYYRETQWSFVKMLKQPLLEGLQALDSASLENETKHQLANIALEHLLHKYYK